MTRTTDTPVPTPLYQVLVEIAGMWALAMAGYYLILPAFGYSISYNLHPVTLAIYFVFWSAISVRYFWNVLSKWLRVDLWIVWYAVLSLALAGILAILLFIFSLFPTFVTPLFSSYTDILFATPWYFLPKAVEILLQQLLVTVLVLELSARFDSLKKVIITYAISFGAIHIFLFLFTGAPVVYATIMTTGALLSALIFPRLILRVHGGFVYAYVIQFAFYIFLAMFLHALPPPGYGV